MVADSISSPLLESDYLNVSDTLSVSGVVTSTNLCGSVLDSNQTEITLLGTLDSLTVDGDVTSANSSLNIGATSSLVCINTSCNDSSSTLTIDGSVHVSNSVYTPSRECIFNFVTRRYGPNWVLYTLSSIAGCLTAIGGVTNLSDILEPLGPAYILTSTFTEVPHTTPLVLAVCRGLVCGIAHTTTAQWGLIDALEQDGISIPLLSPSPFFWGRSLHGD